MVSRFIVSRILNGFVIVLILILPLFLLTTPVCGVTIILPPAITVTFDPCNGDPVQQIQINQGSSIKFPETPVRTGYGFYGWFTEPDGAGRELISNNTPMSDMTVYAYWEINTYFLIYYANMQELRWQDDMDNYPQPYGFHVEHGTIIPLPEPSKLSGYQFLGWNTEKDGSGQTVDENTVVTSQIYLHAQWKPNRYTITFYDWNGIYYGQKVDDYGKLIAYPTHPERLGYRFVGWIDEILVFRDCSVTATYEIISIAPKPDSDFMLNYEKSILSNIPYGTTKQVLINNLINAPSLLRVTLNNETSISDPNAILHTGNRVQLVIDGSVYDNYFLLIDGDPNPERPVGSGTGYYPGANPAVQPTPTIKVTTSTGIAETVKTTAPDNIIETTPATSAITFASIEKSIVPSISTSTANLTTGTDPSANVGTTESMLSGKPPESAAFPPGGPVSTATIMIIIGSTIGSISLIGMVAITQRQRLKAQPDENDPGKEKSL